MYKYGIATVLENSYAGYEFTPDNIPLHVTHVDSFQAQINPAQLEKN